MVKDSRVTLLLVFTRPWAHTGVRGERDKTGQRLWSDSHNFKDEDGNDRQKDDGGDDGQFLKLAILLLHVVKGLLMKHGRMVSYFVSVFPTGLGA